MKCCKLKSYHKEKKKISIEQNFKDLSAFIALRILIIISNPS